MSTQRIWPPDPKPDPTPPQLAEEPRTLHDKVVAAIRKIYDPEIPVNIYDLGLIYKLGVDEPSGRVTVNMTLTTPNCPVADEMPGRVRSKIESIPEVTSAEVNLVWDPPWDNSKMHDDAKLILGIE